MERTIRLSSIVRIAVCFGLGLFCLLATYPGTAAAATHYVYCGAGGTKTGADFDNAYTDLPKNLVRDDTYVVAGSTSCTYGRHNFDDVESGTMLITVRKAVSASDSAVTGWQPSFATAVAEWTVPQNGDPETTSPNSSIQPIWHVCRSYYKLDGITGISDPSAGGPAMFGFLLRSGNYHLIGMINVGTNSCGAGNGVPLTNINLAHVEVNAVNAYLSAPIKARSCSYNSSSGTTTVTLSPTPSWTPVVGDRVDAITAVAGGTNISGSTNVAITSLSSWPTVTFSSSSGPCAKMGALALNFGGSTAVYILGIGTTNTYANITVNTVYLHDFSSAAITTAGVNSLTVENSYIARNRYTPAQHANGWDDHVLQSCCVSRDVNVIHNWWVDIEGTAYIAIFNAGAGGKQSLGTETGWNIYGNVFWQTTPSTLATSQWISCFGTSVQPVACSHFKIFNNTIYNLSGSANGTSARVGWYESDPSSVDIEVYDNLWVADNNVGPQVSRGAVCSNSTAACATTAQLISDYNFYDTHNTGTTSREAHSQRATVTASTFFTAASSGNFGLTAGSNNLLNTHALLPANDTDGRGNSRCAGAGCPTSSANWDAGAFALPTSSVPPPRP